MGVGLHARNTAISMAMMNMNVLVQTSVVKVLMHMHLHTQCFAKPPKPNRDQHRHEVRVRGWPGETPMQLVATTHAHGAWVEGLTPPYPTRPYVMRAY
mgnify:CR=1 FL=1